MRALVVGADGFAGRWLMRHLRDAGDDAVALVGPSFKPPLDAADEILQTDVRDGTAVARALADAHPDVVLYLAGVTTRNRREVADAAVGVSVIGTLNVLMACAHLTRAPRLLFVSSCYVYGPSAGPLKEESPVKPVSLYAAAKLAAEQAILTLGPEMNVDVVVARPFNHTGPGQADSFLVPTLASQIAPSVGARVPADVRVEDASIIRDFTDVRDVVSAYRLLSERGTSGTIYNVASGVGLSVEDIAHEIGSVAGIPVRVTLRENPPPVHEPSEMIGDPRRLEALGWRRQRSLRSTLEDVISTYLSRSASAG